MPNPEAMSEVDVLLERVGQMWCHLNDLEMYQLQRRLDVLLRNSDIETTIRIHNCAGIIYGRQKQHDRALDRFASGLTLARQQGDIYMQGIFLGNMGSAYAAKGECQQALDIFLQYSDLEGENTWKNVFLICGLVVSLCSLRRQAHAEVFFEKGMEHMEQTEPNQLYFFAYAAAALGRYELAVNLLGQLLKVRYGDADLTPLERIAKYEDALDFTEILVDAIAYMEGGQEQQAEMGAHPVEASPENAQLQREVMEAWAPVRTRAMAAIMPRHTHGR